MRSKPSIKALMATPMAMKARPTRGAAFGNLSNANSTAKIESVIAKHSTTGGATET